MREYELELHNMPEIASVAFDCSADNVYSMIFFELREGFSQELFNKLSALMRMLEPNGYKLHFNFKVVEKEGHAGLRVAGNLLKFIELEKEVDPPVPKGLFEAIKADADAWRIINNSRNFLNPPNVRFAAFLKDPDPETLEDADEVIARLKKMFDKFDKKDQGEFLKKLEAEFPELRPVVAEPKVTAETRKGFFAKFAGK